MSVVSELSDYKSLKNIFKEKREGVPYPSSSALKEIVDLLRSVLFPGYYGCHSVTTKTLEHYIGVDIDRISTLLEEQIVAGFMLIGNENTELMVVAQKSKEIVDRFLLKLPEMRATLITDIEAAYNGDPAAKGLSEIILCYPAFKAISNYRIAHELLKLNVPLIPRMIGEMAHSETGIDIHPGAQIGNHFMIDHGTGVVIGETCIIGNHVKIYQGVTLGAKSFELDDYGNPVKNVQRHPIIKDNVVIYANATVLGRITVGTDSVIGSNVWVTNDLPDGAMAFQSRTTR